MQGRSYDECRAILGLSKRSLYRYLAKIYEDDKKLLVDENHQELIIQTRVLFQRFTKILNTLEVMGEDQNISRIEKLAILSAQAQMGRAIHSVLREAPAVALVSQRRAAAASRGFARFSDLGYLPPPPQLSSSSDWGAPILL